MTKKDLPARAANIQRAVASTTTCTPATVESLRSFLLPTEKPVAQSKKQPANLPAPKLKASSIRTGGTAGARARKQPAVGILEVSDEADIQAQAQAHDRIALATEVVNVTLRALSEAIKNPPVQKKRTSLRRTSSNASFNNAQESRTQTPLQSLPVNRLTTTPGEKGHLRRSSSTISVEGRLKGLRAQAECSRIAFATLRSVQNQKDSPIIPYLQLESGMSALIGRLITLGFDEIALKELRILKKRLEVSIGSSVSQNGSKTTLHPARQDAIEPKSEPLVDILKFSNSNVEGPLLALVITTQLQTIKILALKQEPSMIHGALQHLRLKVMHSPANMIQRQIHPDSPGSRDKAIHQLESLAQSLIALCPRHSSAEDCRLSKSSNTLPPHVAFELQLLAFQVRLVWWKISGHRIDLTVEIIEPFNQCLATFRRRSEMDEQERYEVAVGAFKIMADYCHTVPRFREEMLLAVYKNLADVAYESSQYAEASQWVKKARKCAKESEVSQILVCNLDCKLANLLIRGMDSRSSDGLKESLQAAASSLAGKLLGEPVELDELLIIVASLRRSAFSLIQRQHKTDATESPSRVVDTCSQIVLLCVKFLIRYIGNDSSRQENDKNIARYEQRRGLAARISYPMIDSVAAMASLSARAVADEWATLDRGLQDCLALALINRDAFVEDKNASGVAKRAVSPFVSISNAYWYRYQYLKQVKTDPTRLRDCLRTSIDILKNGSACDRLAGSLPTKLEKYAQLSESVRDYQKATETYEEAIHAHIADGLLAMAADAAATRSMPIALECSIELALLSQSLINYTRVALKAANQGCSVRVFVDEGRLRDSERGVLLEQQLIALSYLIQDQGVTATTSQNFTSLAQNLLGIFTKEVYPVRRFRVIVRLLAVSIANPDVLDDASRAQALQELPAISGKPHMDTNLLQFLPHLTACREVLVSLTNGTLDVEKTESAMANWSKMLHDHPDWNALQTQVYDVSDWLLQLELLADYLEMQGLGLTRISVLHILVLVHEASPSKQGSSLVSKLSELSLQYSRVGYSGAAGVVLLKAEKYLTTPNVPVETALRYHLAQAEVAHFNRNFQKSSDCLAKARELFQEKFDSKDNQRLRSRDQSKHSQLIGDVAYLLSLLAAAEGHSFKALYFARQCVKGYQKSWALIERGISKGKKPMYGGRKEEENDVLVDSISELSISESQAVETTTVLQKLPPPSAFWSIVPRLSRGFTNLSLRFAHHGLLPEVRYYLNQAQRISNSVCAPALIGQHSALLGQFLVRGGESSEGSPLLQQAETLLSVIPRGCDYVSLQLFYANDYARHKQYEASRSSLDAAEVTIGNLMKKAFLDSLIHKQSAAENLNLRLSTLTLKDTVTKPTSKARNVPSKKKIGRKLNGRGDIMVSPAGILPDVEAVALQILRSELLQERASTALQQGDPGLAGRMLNEVLSCSYAQHDVVSQALLSSRMQYGQRLEQLVADPVLCVVPESTISHPSIKVCGDSQRQNNAHALPEKANAGPAKPQRRMAPAKKARPRSPSLCDTEMDLLRLAQNELSDVSKLARKLSSTKTIHEITDMFGRILLMLSATSPSTSKRPSSPAFVVYTLEVGRILSTMRESVAVHVENQLSLTKITNLWPGDEAFEDHNTMRSDVDLDFAKFQTEYIDIIPASWTAICMSLSESREELLICKIRAGQPPFILRLPLNRHNSLESDEETFGFDQGRGELREVILSANQSTHGAQDLSQKGAKTAWWEARTALDARLKDLLYNIENIWFGGFKGVFSENVQDSNLLVRFSQSFQSILDKNLPSRQKSGRGNQVRRVTLDHRVLELFVGLGSPSESNDVDEPVMDLLYFVVDILQFNGERNAYDEVDFDSIAIETIDALRHYHQAVVEAAKAKNEQHTILILDKHLHCFPWESMPCLRGQAVTRLPSLRCLRDRVIQRREINGGENPSSEAGRISVNRNSGTSILNPGGDLQGTQSRFEEPLQGLAGWETVIQREPTEVEMKGSLENHEIFLYFGHGSGGQYIRSRTIKKLEKCAVALLIGCSSGTLTEAGEFEPYGTPMSYMHAGCPAMLATLWDVTDKDIDKFSSTVLEKWGLFESAKSTVLSSPVKKSSKQKGKSKIRDAQETTAIEAGPVSLDEAVARGRNSCMLKYLNGAAPVVYGVPVFLS